MQRKTSLKKLPSNSRRSISKAGHGPLTGTPPGRCTSANADTTMILMFSRRSRTASPASHPKPSSSCPPFTALRNSSTRHVWRALSCGVSKVRGERRMPGVQRGWKSWMGGDARSAVAGPVQGIRMYKGIRTGVYQHDLSLVPPDQIGLYSLWLVGRAWAPQLWRSFHGRRVRVLCISIWMENADVLFPSPTV